MTNTIALGLGLLIACFFGLSFFLGLDWHIFLGQKFVDLTEWVAFWR